MSKATLVSRHYETFSEGPRLRASRLRRLEFQTTVRTLHRWLPPTATVLELGAGHGAYSFLLDRMGHRVTATDLLADNVRAMAEKAERHGRPSIRVEQVDASSLAGFPTASYQAVLCLGPYYHLRTWERRRNCLEECRRVADAAGFVAVSYINRVLAVDFLLRSGRPLSPAQYRSIVDPDDMRTDYPDEFFNITHFAVPDTVEAELRSCGLTVVDHVGTDGVAGFFAPSVETLTREQFAAFRDYHLANCGQPAHLYASAHGLVIARPA